MKSQHSLFALALGIVAGPAMAGGILLYEAGQEGAGLANAGSAALATDPSVLMNNPAGLTALDGTQVSLNGQLILGDMGFQRDDDNDFSGNEGGNPLPYLPGSSFFISHKINDCASVGFGMYGNFGLSVDYDDDWAGRYFSQGSTLIGLSLQPTYAYKINDDLSIGFGPRLVYGYYSTEIAIDNNVILPFDRFDDGQVQFKDTDTGVGLNLGLRYQLDERTTLGLAYTSKVDLEFEDSPEFKDIDNPLLSGALNQLSLQSLQVDMAIPQTLSMSVAHSLDEQWTLLASANWQDWSEFGEMGVEVETAAGGSAGTLSRNYHDTWHLSFGAQNQLGPKLRWNMGVAYDSSAVDDKDRTVDNPMNDTWRLATGLNYQVDEGSDLDLAYTLVWPAEMGIEQSKRSGDTLSGELSSSALHIVGGGATWRF